MDTSKREFLRTSLLGAIAGTSPTLLLTNVASAQIEPEVADVPLVVKTDKGWVGLVKGPNGLNALEAADPARSEKIDIQAETPVPDGNYSLGKAGKFSVKGGMVNNSDIDPEAMGISWKDFKEIVIDPKKKIKLDEIVLPEDFRPTGAFILKPSD